MARADFDGQKDAGARILWLGGEGAPQGLIDLFEAHGFALVSGDDASERPPSRIATLDLVPVPARRSRKPSLEDRRIAVAHSDPGVADGMAQTVRALGATAAVISASELGVARVAALQPHVALFDPTDLRGEGMELLRAVWSDPQLRWTPVLLTPSACFDASGNMDFDRMVLCIDQLGAPYDDLMESATTEECFEVPLAELGPIQILRALVETGGCFSAQFETPALDINVDVAEGIIVGAQRQGDRERVLGPRALAILTRQTSGHVFVVQSERPGVTNIMAPIETALSAASTERSSWLPSHAPPATPNLEPPTFVVGKAPDAPQATHRGVGPDKAAMPRASTSIGFPSPGRPPAAAPPKADDEEVTQVAQLPEAPPEPSAPVSPGGPKGAARAKAAPPPGTLLGMPALGKPENDGWEPPKPPGAKEESGSRQKHGPGLSAPTGAAGAGALPKPAAFVPLVDEPEAPTLPPASRGVPPDGAVDAGHSEGEPEPLGRPDGDVAAARPAAEPVAPPPAAAPAPAVTAAPAAQAPAARPAADPNPELSLPLKPSLGSQAAALVERARTQLLEPAKTYLQNVDWEALAQTGREALFWARHSRVAWGIGGALLLLIVLSVALSGDDPEPVASAEVEQAPSEAQAAPEPVAAEQAAPAAAAPAVAKQKAPVEEAAAVEEEAVAEEEAPAEEAAAAEEEALAEQEALDEEALDEEAEAEAAAEEDDAKAEADAADKDKGPTPYQRASNWVSHGNRHLRGKRYKPAESSFKNALLALPDFPRAIEGLTQVYLASHDRKKALASARRLVRLRPGRARHHRLLGDAYAANMDIANAQRAWKQAAAKGDRTAKKRLGQ